MSERRFQGQGYRDGDSGERFPYIADEGLVEAVNMALLLHRPLLIKGPPGCGKTKLAEAVAFELGVNRANIHPWRIKSTSRARDGLYSIDMIRRLQDSHTTGRNVRLANYIRLGPLGRAIEEGIRGFDTVVLIDEIDKADIDFPNDLLFELDQNGFEIEELDEADLTPDDPIRREYKNPNPAPIIIVTSNDEKELPDAFLRRCLFYYIHFPEKEHLKTIVRVNFEAEGFDLDEELVELAIDRLNAIRATGEFRKKPATSELLDWLMILHHWGVDTAKAQLAASDLANLPYLATLLKHQQDYKLIQPDLETG